VALLDSLENPPPLSLESSCKTSLLTCGILAWKMFGKPLKNCLPGLLNLTFPLILPKPQFNPFPPLQPRNFFQAKEE